MSKILIIGYMYMIVMVFAGIFVLHEIETYQLNRDCIEWGWTYCIRK